MTNIQIGISLGSILAIIGVLLKIMLSDRDKRIDKNEKDIEKLQENMATKDDLNRHKDSLKQDMSEMKGDIKLILSHILGAKNET